MLVNKPAVASNTVQSNPNLPKPLNPRTLLFITKPGGISYKDSLKFYKITIIQV